VHQQDVARRTKIPSAVGARDQHADGIHRRGNEGRDDRLPRRRGNDRGEHQDQGADPADLGVNAAGAQHLGAVVHGPDVEHEPKPEGERDHVRQPEIETHLRALVTACVREQRERHDDARGGDGIDRHHDRAPSRIAGGTLGAERDVAEQCAQEPEDRAEEGEYAEPLRRFAQEVGRKRSVPTLGVPK